jgi:hypothetical protein
LAIRIFWMARDGIEAAGEPTSINDVST